MKLNRYILCHYCESRQLKVQLILIGHEFIYKDTFR